MNEYNNIQLKKDIINDILKMRIGYGNNDLPMTMGLFTDILEQVVLKYDKELIQMKTMCNY